MKEQAFCQHADKTKAFAIGFLYLTSAGIALLGLAFGWYSFVNGVNFSVMNTQMPGAIFGLVVLFLGIRYFFAVNKLKAEVYKSASRFSWNNFKKSK